MEAFMVHLRDVRIERDEFEIAQRDRLIRLQQPPCVRTLPLFEKIRDRSNFSLDVALEREIVGSYKPRKMQEKLTAQGQRIYCSLTRVRKYIVLMGAYERYQVVYGGRSVNFGRFLIGRPENSRTVPLLRDDRIHPAARPNIPRQRTTT